jgi:flagellar biosynthesis protein FliQ
MLQAIQLVLVIVAVLVVPGLLVGLLVSLFQAATQINEQTLSFLPRLMVTLLALALSALVGHPAHGFLRALFPIRQHAAGLSLNMEQGLYPYLLQWLQPLWWPFVRTMALLSFARSLATPPCPSGCASSSPWCWP